MNKDKLIGSLVGLAVGDAIGTTVEFKDPGSFAPLTDMVGGGPFRLEKGQWTDDTSMALCLAESLVENNGFDANDQMDRYCKWWKQGYMSSTGRCFDIGNTTATALRKYLETGEPYSGMTEYYASGNGCIMRISPIAIYYHSNYNELLKYAGESSRTTHGSPVCIDASKYFCAVLQSAYMCQDKISILENVQCQPSTEEVAKIAFQDYKSKHIDDIFGSGYVVDCLEASLWCFFNTDSFDEAVLQAANLGDDADTTAAVTGQLAGMFYGLSGIRNEWKESLHQYEMIKTLAENLKYGK